MNTISGSGKRFWLALLSILFLILAGPFLQSTPRVHSLQTKAHLYSTEKINHQDILPGRNLSQRRRVLACLVEDVESEESKVRKADANDEAFWLRRLCLIAHQLLSSTLKINFNFPDSFSDLFSGKRYLLIRVFRI